MSVAFVFAGQGAESPRMGLELADHSATARKLLEQAAAAVDVDLFRLLKRGGRHLDRTEVLQPALTAVCLGAFQELARGGVRPRFVAGHSLGELAAWCAAGCITPSDAIAVSARRGVLMATEAVRHPGGMLAFNGLDWPDVEPAIRRGRKRGVVDLAAHNAPQQWVVSGDEPGLQAAASAQPSQRLRVAGAWHSRLMTGAVEPLRQALRALDIKPAEARFVANRTGAEVRDDASIPDLLAEQLLNPIRWTSSMQALARLGVADLVTVGPGRVLRGLVRKTLGLEVRLHAAETLRDIAATIEALG